MRSYGKSWAGPCQIRFQQIQVHFLPFCFTLVTSVSMCLFLLCFFFSLFFWGLICHILVGHLIFISKQFLQGGNWFLPTISGRVKSSTLPTIFFSKQQTKQTPLVTIIPPFVPTEGCSNESQQCHCNLTSAVQRSFLRSTRFRMCIHSQSIDHVRRLEACQDCFIHQRLSLNKCSGVHYIHHSTKRPLPLMHQRWNHNQTSFPSLGA